MKQIIVLGTADETGAAFIREMVGDTYQVAALTKTEQVIQQLDENSTEIDAVVIHKPSVVPDVDTLLSYVHLNNSVIFAIPLLILTEEDYYDADKAYLKDPVLDIIYIGESSEIVKNRIRLASQIVNSASFSEFAGMLQVLPSLIYLKDAKGRYVFCSQYWHHLEHYNDPDWTIVGKTDMEIRKDIENARRAYESDLRIIKNGKGTSYVIEENEDGQQEFLQIIKEPLKYEDGRVRGIIALINNVTEQELLKRKLEKMSFTDELTGMYNRAYMDVFRNTITGTDYPISILSADCDNLKLVNDRFGHMVGDEYIRMAVTLMKTELPESSVICRMGGDEFMVFLPRTNEETAKAYLKSLHEAEDMFRIRNLKLSVSFGSATINEPGETLESAIVRSDAEMCKNKQERKAKM